MQSNGNIRPPPPLTLLSTDVSKSWQDWYQQFEWYSTVIELEKKAENMKLALFMSAIGQEAVSVYNTFPDDKKATLKDVVTAFRNYFTPKVNVTYERFIFNKIVQTENEKFDDFLTELLSKSKSCQFGSLHDSLVTDRIVIGVYSDSDREKLLSADDLTLDKAIKICKANEQARSQMSSLKFEPLKIESVKKKQIMKKNTKEKQSFSNRLCTRCNTSHKKGECLAYKKQCFACHREGHFSICCRSKQKHIAAVNSSCSEDSRINKDIKNLIISSVINDSQSVDWYETAEFQNRFKVKFKLDTGAQCNVLPYSIAKKASLNVKWSNVHSLISFSNHKMKVCGESFAKLKIKSKTYSTRFIVIKEMLQPILGKDSCVEMGLVKRVNSIGLADKLINTHAVEDEIGCLKNFTYDIDLIDDPKLEIFPARRVPHSIRDKIKDELDRMQRMGIIKPVTDPTPAVSPMVVVHRNSKIRVCMDPSSLNKNLRRRHYPLKTLEEIAAHINGSKWFTLLDCKKGFWQLKVTERTSRYLTMATPWGRFSYLRMPMGLSSAPEVFQQVIEHLLGSIEDVECAMDDILIHASSKEKLQKTTDKVMKILTESGLTLNKEKCVYLQNSVKFLGHIVTDVGLKADPEKIEAISELKVPENVTALQRFLGMVTYLAKFVPNLSEITLPLRRLCKKDVIWTWNNEQQTAFEKLKEILKKLPTLKYFNVNLPITLSVDSSKHSVGAVIMQEGRPVAYAAKALDKTQQNYSQIEKEAFAIKFGCLRFHQYLWGCKKLTVETDHKPLVSISKKPLHSAPPRLQRIMFDIMPYRPEIIYKRGTEMYIADTLSRDCNTNTNMDMPELVMEIHVVVPMTEERTTELIQALKDDQELSQLMQVIKTGWPEDVKEVPAILKKYWTFRDEFAVYDNILFRGDRIVIPHKLVEPTLEAIHLGHLGIQHSLSRARESVYWIGMNKDITLYVKQCNVCQRRQRDNPEEPLILNKVPERPWQIVGTDIFHLDRKNYLVIADSYSGYFDFCVLNNLSSTTVIQALKSWFATHGIPETLCSDAGTQLVSKEFHHFAKEWNINLQISSPEHKRSNGLAERYVQEAKNFLAKCAADGSDVCLSLLNNRNTPRGVLGSPVQRLMGRRTRGLLPMRAKMLKPSTIKNVTFNLTNKRLKDKEYRDRGSKSKSPISIGQKVWFRQSHRKWTPAEVIAPAQGPRSFIIKTSDGATYRRNTWFLRPNLTPDEPSPVLKDSVVVKEETHHPEIIHNQNEPVPIPAIPKTPESSSSTMSDAFPQSKIIVTPVPHVKSPVCQRTPGLKTRSGRTVKKPVKLDL